MTIIEQSSSGSGTTRTGSLTSEIINGPGAIIMAIVLFIIFFVITRKEKPKR